MRTRSTGVLVAAALALAAGVAIAQPESSVRVRGTITAVHGDIVSLTARDGRPIELHLDPKAGVAVTKATSLEELKPGTYVGSAAVRKGGRLVALEVHTLPPQAAPGQRPWDVAPGSSMTNANLSGVVSKSGGSEITLKYAAGSQKIFVPKGTPVTTSAPGSRADLQPGESVFAIAQRSAGGTLTTQRIQVSKDGVRPAF